MVVVVFAALTLGPAVITVVSRFGLLEPKRAMRVRGWRKVGAAVVRWPGPILIATIALSLIGLLTLPGYKTNYNDRNYLPSDLPANEGYAAADRHFSQARMNPELLMIESDHDLRNSADFLVIDKIAKAIFRVPGIARVQAITRPEGTPIEHTSIPFLISMQGTSQKLTEKYNQDLTANMLEQADDMQTTIDQMERMQSLTQQMADVTHGMVAQMKGMTIDIQELRDNIANFDDFFRPIRNYFYWEPHCFDIPICWSIRSVFDTLDGIDTMTDDIQELMPEMERLDTLMPQLIALMPAMIATMKTMKTMMLTMYATQKGMQDQQAAMQGELDGHGRGVRRVEERRLVLSAAGNLRQRRLQARHEELHLAGRQVGALHHLPRRRSDDARGHRAHRRDQAGGQGSDQGHAAGGIQDLPRRHRGDVQGHAGRHQL